MMNAATRVLLYTQQPFVGRGLKTVLESRPDFQLTECLSDFESVARALETDAADLALVYLTRGISLSELRALRGANPRTPVVLWGQGFSQEFLFQTVQLGIRGMLACDTSVDDLLAALERVRGGQLYFDAEVLGEMLMQKRVVLSPRETQIVSLVAQGLKNKEIAYSLGLTEGTVKVYLSRIFRKLDMNDRLDLALYGLKNLFGGQAGIGRPMPVRPGLGMQVPRSLPLRQRVSTPAVH